VQASYAAKPVLVAYKAHGGHAHLRPVPYGHVLYAAAAAYINAYFAAYRARKRAKLGYQLVRGKLVLPLRHIINGGYALQYRVAYSFGIAVHLFLHRRQLSFQKIQFGLYHINSYKQA
jgi:hypothetical protein